MLDSQNPAELTADELIARAMQAAGLDPATIGNAQDTDEVLIQAMQAAGLDPTTIGTSDTPDTATAADASADETATEAADEASPDDLHLALADLLPDGQF